MTKLLRFAFVSIAAAIFMASAFAQEFRGTLSGSVTDSTGAQIPGAKIVVTETNTGTKIESVSDSTGQYTIPFLAPGDYDIAVTKEGFKEALRKSVHVG